jgi:selenocysteine lyase/cysteine desulfurase
MLNPASAVPPSPVDQFDALRANFPGLASSIYFDTASRGLVPAQAKAAIVEQIAHRMQGDSDKAEMFESIKRVRELYAKLIGAEPHEIAFTKNVSEGLNIVAAGLPWKPGDNVIVCSNLEHPSNIYPWLNLKARVGIEVRDVPSSDGFMPVKEMMAAIDGRTRVVTCSLVTFAPGLRSDIQQLAEYCESRKILFLVDAAQAIGILDIDMARTPISAMSVSTQKGLLGLYGMGFLYVRENWAERIETAFLSRFSVDLGRAHEATGGGGNYSLMPGAQRFEVGNYNYVGAAAVEPGLSIVTSLTTRAIEDRVHNLTTRMIEGLRRAGVPVFAPQPGIHRAHIVAIGEALGNQHDTTDDPKMHSLYTWFTENGVRLIIRRGILRASFHFYNNAEDVDRLVDIARHWVSKAA